MHRPRCNCTSECPLRQLWPCQLSRWYATKLDWFVADGLYNVFEKCIWIYCGGATCRSRRRARRTRNFHSKYIISKVLIINAPGNHKSSAATAREPRVSQPRANYTRPLLLSLGRPWFVMRNVGPHSGSVSLESPFAIISTKLAILFRKYSRSSCSRLGILGMDVQIHNFSLYSSAWSIAFLAL